MKRVLVVGGSGFVGSHIVRALAAAGVRPVVFGPAMEGGRLADLAGGFDAIEGSILSRGALRDALGAGDMDAVVGCAAYGAGRLGLLRSGEADPDAAMEVNVLGLGRMLDAARKAGVRRVVWTSSTVVYGPPASDAPVDEDATVGPMTLYGLTKVLAEQVSAHHRRQYGLDVVALRLPLVLGSGLWYDGAAAGLAGLFRLPPPPVLTVPDGPFDLVHVEDAAAAVLGLLRHGGPLAPVYNLEGFRCRAADVLRCIQARRPGPPVRLDPAPALPLPPITGARLRADTGFAAAHDLEGLVDAMLEDAGC